MGGIRIDDSSGGDRVDTSVVASVKETPSVVSLQVMGGHELGKELHGIGRVDDMSGG